MATSEEARSLSYKISVDPQDYERVTTDASVWPNLVGIRRFKQFTGPRSEQRYSDHGGTHERDNNYNGNQEQGRYPGYQNYENRRPGAGQKSRGVRGYDGNVGSRYGGQY